MKKSIIIILALLTGTTALISEKFNNSYKIDDAKELQDFLLAKDSDLSGKDYDLNNDGVWNVFDLCLMKKKLINQDSEKIEFGKQIKNDFIVDNVLNSETQGDIHFSSYIPESYPGLNLMLCL